MEEWQVFLSSSAGAYIDTLTSGFDPEGAKGLKGELVGYRKWIGTAGRSVFQNQSISQLITARARTVRGIHV